jgi:hypothetical protein
MSGENSTLVELGEIKGQLKLMTQMLQQNHDSTNQRIDDLRHSMEARAKGLEERVGKLETNERGTAIKAGVAGAISGVIATAAIAAVKLLK